MGHAAIQLDVSFQTVECGCCGGVYALTSRFVDEKRAKGESWTCPYCEVGWGFKESAHKKEVRELKEKIERERRQREWAEQRAESARAREETVRRSRAAIKGQLTKTKKRVGRGVCPCCNRSFENLRRHMESKHPEYADEPVEDGETRAPEKPAVSDGVCGAETADGSPCGRRTVSTDRCWQHA